MTRTIIPTTMRSGRLNPRITTPEDGVVWLEKVVESEAEELSLRVDVRDEEDETMVDVFEADVVDVEPVVEVDGEVEEINVLLEAEL